VFAHMQTLPAAEKRGVAALVAHISEAYSTHGASDEDDEAAIPQPS